ncbi:MAG: M20/M25/M40 family metallo-hydrolase, partial [Candidatus Lokiarchaeota archaeon]|nr:M20/M25/M40 family metallo-hydrolase [Candidatus Lokiarchaeota archaeon]MBD3201547.1 M20/M25/M40 family metallo-hydrolase [Candidatus Lokiarchaeota archaeon]
VEPDMEILFTQIEEIEDYHSFSEELNVKLLHILYIMPHGPISTHPKNPDLVYTSTNLASIKTKGSTLKITTSQRSLHEISKTIMYEKIVSIFKLADMDIKIEFEQEYPGWAPDFEANLLKVAKETYVELFNNDPIVQTIHAGLECGILKSKFPEIEMISLGPYIKDAHSPDERLMINSVEKIWNLLKSLVKNLN